MQHSGALTGRTFGRNLLQTQAKTWATHEIAWRVATAPNAIGQGSSALVQLHKPAANGTEEGLGASVGL
jgi:hypothetical protein